ncbi:hypothetical protein V1264_017491 [Littorina saxatilis]|uniref:Uncharacterized protein n=1 Tax=Littorina saxatilis TaxID=31220 RepID=A0AAN9BJQ2_9CAEN
MASSARNILLCACFVLSLAAQGSEAACTQQELILMFSCIVPYNAQFFAALGQDSSIPCDRTLITGDLCASFAKIVPCVNSKQVSDVTCRPGAVGQINANLDIPCKVEDFEAMCTSSPAINRGSGSGSTTFNGASPLLVATLISAAVTSLGWR